MILVPRFPLIVRNLNPPSLDFQQLLMNQSRILVPRFPYLRRTSMQTESEFVTLCGGLSPPIAPVRLALDLEAAGFQLSRDGDDILIRPFSKLTDEDKQQLKLWKRHVLALLDYAPPEVQ